LTYYVAVKAVDGNFDHMAAYFPLVMGDAPSLWLNNHPAGSIKSWADLSQAFTSVTHAFLAPNKSPNKSRLFSKLSR
jgi:hypothetical protein